MGTMGRCSNLWDIKDVPVQPYPSAMDWATNPENYHNYYSNVWWTPEVAP